MINLEDKAREIRGMILDQVYQFKNGHIASAFSLVEILLTLYWQVLKVNTANPDWENRDRLILSKGHGVSALYAVLADLEFFPKEYLIAPQDGNLLGGHADRKVPGVDWSTGSLGHGLSVAAGMALAAKMNKRDYRVFCILGDGELQEGSVWEAAMFASQHQLTNLIAIIDYNKYQSCGEVMKIVTPEPIYSRWRTFGWWPIEVYGHDMRRVNEAFACCELIEWEPRVVIAHTQKGHGVSFIETGDKWHTGIPSAEELLAAKKELGLA